MPYDNAQVRLFQMIAHGKAPGRKGLSPKKAKSLLTEAGQSHNNGHPQSASRKLSA